MALLPGQSDPDIVSRLHAAAARFETEPEAARAELEALIAEEPDCLPARRALARMLRHHGELQRAGIIELEAITLGLQRPQFVKAQTAFMAGNLDAAEPLIRAHLRSDPEDPAGALMLGEIAAKVHARKEAENLFGRAILLAPAYGEARLALARLLRDQGRYTEAIEALTGLLTQQPAHLSALALRAAILVQLRRFDEADRAFEEIHERHPQDARSWANHAHMLKTVGRQADAITAYRHALTIAPSHPQSWWGLANLKTVRFTPDDVEKLRKVIEEHDGAASKDDHIHLLYALGKACDDNDDVAAAFEAYSQGARLRLQQVPHDPDKVTEHVHKSTQVCTPTFFTARGGWGSPAPDPIFIVSLPRSGSTLVEQILASHPQIEGTEELHDIERIALSLAPTGGTGGWLDVLPTLDSTKMRELGDHYIDATQRFRHTDRPFFTDKMPSNWIFTGLIAAMLPNAKIIDIRRHPLGCGFANFSQHFNWGINFSYDLSHIGKFYTAYVRQMAHFDSVLPGRIHHVTYEDLVENTEAEIRRLLDYLELPFEPACLRFFENPRAVYTPSSEQVRSPITREGMERWQRYEAFLGPLKEALGPVLEHYPNPPPKPRHHPQHPRQVSDR
ncbi:Tetratricopeptide repeat-containing protein [Novosphingobium sp. CF614]|nr:Tetratricopeptide repeat-containing protein [Novosphingobium sp. CF614]